MNFPIGAKLVKYMHETGVYQFPQGPEEKSAFEYANGMKLWEFLEKNEAHRRDFDKFMSLRRQGLPLWHETFPMASQLCPAVRKNSQAVLLVDIGGGRGHDIQSFHNKNPDVSGRLILQDLAIVLDEVETQGILEGIELMRHDIFTPQPVKGFLPTSLHFRASS